MGSKYKFRTPLLYTFFLAPRKASKNAEFHADFKSVGKVKKIHQKSYKKNKFDEHE
jgi:hypothetical protein